jgi:SNF2 family DNA or RNA helicase
MSALKLKSAELLSNFAFKFNMRRYSLRLDGSTSLARRRYETALFNKPDGRHFVYLCSTRAGGLGINLQSADTVGLCRLNR